MLTIAPDWRSPANDLVSAASVGNMSAVEKFLKSRSADINEVNGESGWTPLMYASNYGNYNVVRALIQNGCIVDFQDPNQGRTALMLAACNGHTRCMEVLINIGNADKDIKDIDGHDALYYAKTSGHGNNKMIRTLLENTGEVKSRLTKRKPNKRTAVVAPNVTVASTEARIKTKRFCPLSPSNDIKQVLLRENIWTPNYETSVFGTNSAPFWMPPKVSNTETTAITSTKISPTIANPSFEATPVWTGFPLSELNSTHTSQASQARKVQRKAIVGRSFY